MMWPLTSSSSVRTRAILFVWWGIATFLFLTFFSCAQAWDAASGDHVGDVDFGHTARERVSPLTPAAPGEREAVSSACQRARIFQATNDQTLAAQSAGEAADRKRVGHAASYAWTLLVEGFEQQAALVRLVEACAAEGL